MDSPIGVFDETFTHMHVAVTTGLLYLVDHGSTDHVMNIFHCSLEMFISIVSVL